MSDLVARTGRLQQRYEGGFRLVAGCIPFRYRISDNSGESGSEKIIEVLMISSQSGPGLLFPKGGWENDETVEEAAVREAIEEAGVRGELKEELESWPEQSTRNRSWLTVPEAFERCRHEWMRVALDSFSKWHQDYW
ncbi:nudix hydrolase 16, mitochondrial isoform X2 [Neltuma alba]|uniref:nudix hydrolase 16, mitochondrial isoform X2 n=1 Tax=Neltuma alba TaxID=207710 RepID=UPI0010A4D538|nr:nudix hydrolase 16, mitochondrial-like isoform X2 [Prosopis alba]